MENVLIAGATGHLGSYVTKEFKARNYHTKVLVRKPEKFRQSGIKTDEVVVAGVTDRVSLTGCCRGVDIVFSSVGITRQKDGLTYMKVDYQANMNLLDEAIKAGVKKFIYVSVFNGENLRQLKICEAKEKFVDALRESGMPYCIIRPTGYFSDMGDFFRMAKKGRIYLFGSGKNKMNPISAEDLARICVNVAQSDIQEMEAGGPEILSYNKIADWAFEKTGKKKKITHIPDWASKLFLALLRTFTGSKTYGPIEFFMTVLSMDMVAPRYGHDLLAAYFETLKTA